MCLPNGLLYKFYSIRSQRMLIIAAVITLALIAERLTYAWVRLGFHLFNQGTDGKSTWFISSFVQSASSAIGAMTSSVMRLMSFSISSVLCLVLILVMWGLLYAVARDGQYALAAFQSAYNSSVGGALRFVVVLPLQLLHMLCDWIIPAYNLLIYCIETVPTRVLFENVLWNMSPLLNCVSNLGMFMQRVVMSLSDYVQLIINQPDSFDPNLRLLDLITPLAYLRLAVSYMLTWLGQMCAIASSLLDIVFYPFMDINFGLGMHNTVNSILTLVIQTPVVTLNRCRAGGGPIVYCIPDFEPAIELMVNGIRNFGSMVDNWLDVTYLIVEAILTGTNPACTGWSVVDFETKASLFGNNETVIVGIDSNSFAKTDGWNIEVYLQSGVVQTFSNAFPFAVNLNYGIASVSATPDVPGLLGCACMDLSYGMQIICGVAPMDKVTASYFAPVEFDVPTTSFYMGCDRSKIRVDSIRWPVTRFSSPNSNVVQPGSLVAQAALWVRPDCSDEHIDVACIQTFALSGCYPFCMALWTQGYVGSLILRGANEWQNTVSMVERDCGLHTWDVTSGYLAQATQALRTNSGVTSTWMNAEVQLDSTSCVYAPNTFSRMLRNVTTAYNVYQSTILPGQPFAFAGDLVLTAVNTVGNTWGISVQRIYGNQVCTYISLTALCELDEALLGLH